MIRRLSLPIFILLPLLAYGVGIFFDAIFELPLLKNIFGLALPLSVVPFSILVAVRPKGFSPIEIVFTFIIIFFSGFVPIYFFLNQAFGFVISESNIIILSTCIIATSLIIAHFRNAPIGVPTLPARLIPSVLRKERVVLIALSAFFLLHAVNYHFYGFIPEWDSYSDLIAVNDIMETGIITEIYRGFFRTSVAILSTFSGIDPYHVFSAVFVALQATTILSIRILIGRYGIKSVPLQSLAYTLALSVPAINMEIDMTRPQNIFILLFPMFLVFASRFLSERHIPSAFFALVIALSGMNYHEFFIFPLFLSAGYIGYNILHLAITTKDAKDRSIATLSIVSGVLVTMFLFEKSGFVSGAFLTAKSIVFHILEIEKWRWWFIGNYSGDGSAEVGWPGIDGAIKYYAYYLSPAFTVLLAALVALFIKRHEVFRDPLIRISSAFIAIFLLFAEILPRLNHVYLPERFWLLIDLSLLFAAIPMISLLETSASVKKVRLGLFMLAIVGLGGSLYVASAKRSLTSPEEYAAATWIHKHTTENSSFITQAANGPMITFFAKRTVIPVGSEYFLGKDVLERDPRTEIEKRNRYIDEQNKEVRSLLDRYTENEISFFEFADKIQEKKSVLKKTEKEIEALKKLIDQPKYVVYSFNKFDTLYREREWWMRANAYGANIEKFNNTYPLVYKRDGVYIWKVR